MTLFIIFLIGLCLGSFLNVVIDRWPKNKSVVTGRSHCDFCKKTLSPLDLIPVISYLFLRGKCRYCHKKLSWQYPLVEFATGVLLVLTYLLTINLQQFNNLTNSIDLNVIVFGMRLISLFVLTLYFIVIFMVDLKYEIILERVINSAIILTVFCHLIILLLFYLKIFVYYDTAPYHSIFSYPLIWSPFKTVLFSMLINFLTGIIVALFFRFLIFVSRGRGLGEGDIKLGFWLGLLLGFPNILPGMFLAFVSGGIVGLFLVMTKIKKFGQTVPLAPFLVSGSYIAFFFGEKIISWYLKTYLIF